VKKLLGVVLLSPELKWRLKNTTIDKTITYTSVTWTLTKRDTKQLNVFERKVYRRILGPVYGNEKDNWRILTNEDIYAIVKKPTITGTIKLHRLCWFGHVQGMEGNNIPKNVLYMNLETTRLRGRPRNRWQDDVRIVGGDSGVPREGLGGLKSPRNSEVLTKLSRIPSFVENKSVTT
jgi:hypothetical protein